MTRPPIVGLYELLQDFEARDASIRVFEVSAGERSVNPHVHQHSTQYYVALEGRVVIELDGVENTLEPYGVLEVPEGVMHAARSAGVAATVLNISVPPLRADDQVPVALEAHHPDLTLPSQESDLED